MKHLLCQQTAAERSRSRFWNADVVAGTARAMDDEWQSVTLQPSAIVSSHLLRVVPAYYSYHGSILQEHLHASRGQVLCKNSVLERPQVADVVSDSMRGDNTGASKLATQVRIMLLCYVTLYVPCTYPWYVLPFP